jgi:negative regulator of genetic competence, sporulation and motility
MRAAARAMGAETTRVTPPDDKCRENLRHAEREMENDNNNHPRQKKNDKFHIILCFASLSKLIIARERESWEKISSSF